MGKIKLNTIDHINIVVSDLQATAAFFLKLEFEVLLPESELGPWLSETVGLEDVHARYMVIALPGDSIKLELITYDNPPGPKNPHIGTANAIGFRHIALTVDDIEETVAGLKAAGIETQGEIQFYKVTGKRFIYFKGPDNILLELAQYPTR